LFEIFRQLPVKCQVIAEKAKNGQVLLMILLPIQQRFGVINGPRTAMGELRGGLKVAQPRPITRSRVLIALSLTGCAAA
jgi:hypothetical protein